MAAICQACDMDVFYCNEDSLAGRSINSKVPRRRRPPASDIQNLKISCPKTHLTLPINRAPVSGAREGFPINIREDVSMHIVMVSVIVVGLVYLLWQIRP